jgi:hypothetical protein
MIEESLATFRELGDRWSVAYALTDLVNPVLIQGNQVRAQSFS